MFSLDVEWGVRIQFAGLKYWIGTRDYWNGRSRDSLRLCILCNTITWPKTVHL